MVVGGVEGGTYTHERVFMLINLWNMDLRAATSSISYFIADCQGAGESGQFLVKGAIRRSQTAR